MRVRLFLAAVAATVLSASCAAPTDAGRTTAAYGIGQKYPSLPPDIQKQLGQLRELTTPFQDLAAANAAGFDTDISGCVADPTLGGMGHHYANVSRLDGSASLLEPEIMVFFPTENGRLRLGAVEYVIPFPAWNNPTPPRLLGMDFHPNPVIGVWMLHVWIWEFNSAGLFADWNPAVSCS